MIKNKRHIWIIYLYDIWLAVYWIRVRTHWNISLFVRVEYKHIKTFWQIDCNAQVMYYTETSKLILVMFGWVDVMSYWMWNVNQWSTNKYSRSVNRGHCVLLTTRSGISFATRRYFKLSIDIGQYNFDKFKKTFKSLAVFVKNCNESDKDCVFSFLLLCLANILPIWK